jgi:hypothetical protein
MQRSVTFDKKFLGDIEFRYRYYRERDAELKKEADARNGSLARHDCWRRAYYNFPYMIGSDYPSVRQRFIDVVWNINDINESAQLTPRLEFQNGFLMTQKFTHVLEELNTRGGLPTDAQADLFEPIRSYFADGEPIGLEALSRYPRPSKPFLVKYSKLQYLRDAFQYGRFRICPASSYAAEIHNRAIRDSELQRPLIMPTYLERMRGETQIIFQGHEFKFGSGDLIVPIVSPDFYVYCLSESIYYRLPTDFHADAVLIIRDPKEFIYRLVRAFRQIKFGYQPVAGPVTYYDPYTDHKSIKLFELSKHLRYSYQREYRVAFLPDSKDMIPDGEIFAEIGSMKDYADLLELPA